MKKLIFFLICTFVSLDLYATAQIPDKIVYQGKIVDLLGSPLEFHPNREQFTPEKLFNAQGCFFTACWRGYVATWSVENDELYLLQIRNACYPTPQGDVVASYKSTGDKPGSEYADLKKLFGGEDQHGKIFAGWYSGELYMPQGPLVYYVHDGFQSSYSKELKLQIQNGIITSKEVCDNSKSHEVNYSEPEWQNKIYSAIHWDILPADTIKRVIVVFSGNEEGVIDSIEVRRSGGDLYDQEAVKAIKALPGTIRYVHGKFVRTKWTMPVNFNNRMRKTYSTGRPATTKNFTLPDTKEGKYYQ